MKSAISLLKLVAFLLALQWLCSCGTRQRNIKMLMDYRDSVGLTKLRLNSSSNDMQYYSQQIQLLSKYERIVDSLKLEIQ